MRPYVPESNCRGKATRPSGNHPVCECQDVSKYKATDPIHIVQIDRRDGSVFVLIGAVVFILGGPFVMDAPIQVKVVCGVIATVLAAVAWDRLR